MSAITGHAAIIQAQSFTGFRPMMARSVLPKEGTGDKNEFFSIKDFRNYCFDNHYNVFRQNSDASSKLSIISSTKHESSEDESTQSLRNPIIKNDRSSTDISTNLSFGIDAILGSTRRPSKDSDSASVGCAEITNPHPTPTVELLQSNIIPNIKELYERQYRLYVQYFLYGYGQNGIDMLTEYYRKGGFVPEVAYKNIITNSQEMISRANSFNVNQNTSILKQMRENHSPNTQYTSPADRDSTLAARQSTFCNYLTEICSTANNAGEIFPGPIRKVEYSTRRRRRWKRAVFSLAQRKELESSFKCHKYVTKPERKKLAETLRLSENQVKIWYQNRRMKWRQTPKADESIQVTETTEA